MALQHELTRIKATLFNLKQARLSIQQPLLAIESMRFKPEEERS